MMRFFISQEGDDGWDGSEARDGREGRGPWRTLAGAVCHLARLSKEWPSGEVIDLIIGAGIYTLERGIRISVEQLGGRHVRLIAGEEGTARLRGSLPLHGGTSPVPELERLPARIRENVLAFDLGVLFPEADLAWHNRGFTAEPHPAPPEVYGEGGTYRPARWPRDFFAEVAALDPEKAREGADGWGHVLGEVEDGFGLPDGPWKHWKMDGSPRMSGYLHWNWADFHFAIRSVDKERGWIHPAPPYPAPEYRVKAGARFYLWNILEAIEAPGDYVIDETCNRLYVWPYPGDDARLRLSLLNEAMLVVDGMDGFACNGLVFEECRDTAIHIIGGEGNTIENCEIRDTGRHGVHLDGSRGHRVAGCEIVRTGACGVSMRGGDVATLESGGHVVEGCHIHQFGRWERTYQPGVGFGGVGHRLENNHIHDGPHSAILFTGSEHVVVRNRIHDVCMETDDCGAIYFGGRNFAHRGNRIGHNHLTRIGQPYYHGVNGIYLDDCVSGHYLHDNYFDGVARAVFIGGGVNIRMDHNCFINCDPALHLDDRGQSVFPVWNNMLARMKTTLEATAPEGAIHWTRYPELARVRDFLEAGKGVPPVDNRVRGCVFIGGRLFDHKSWDADKRCPGFIWEDNWVDGQLEGEGEEKP